jgi:hypothetical protein
MRYEYCENCGQKMRWIKADYHIDGGFYRCYHTIGVICECGHTHKSHNKKEGCLKCKCKSFKDRKELEEKKTMSKQYQKQKEKWKEQGRKEAEKEFNKKINQIIKGFRLRFPNEGDNWIFNIVDEKEIQDLTNFQEEIGMNEIKDLEERKE